MLIHIGRVVPETHIGSGRFRTVVDLVTTRELEEDRCIPIPPREVVGPTTVVGRLRVAPDVRCPVVDVELLTRCAVINGSTCATCINQEGLTGRVAIGIVQEYDATTCLLINAGCRIEIELCHRLTLNGNVSCTRTALYDVALQLRYLILHIGHIEVCIPREVTSLEHDSTKAELNTRVLCLTDVGRDRGIGNTG